MLLPSTQSVKPGSDLDFDFSLTAFGPSTVPARSLARGLLVDVEVLRGPDRGRPASQARALAAYVLGRRLGYRMTDVAAALGRNIATTSVAAREVSEQLPQDEAAARQVERLVESLEAKVEA
jgi:hypothetical protein